MTVEKMSIQSNGITFDETSRVCVLQPEVKQQTKDLKSECKDFVENISDFQTIVSSFIEMVDKLAKQVEKEKMKAISSRNSLKSIEKQREAKQQQLRALISEKQIQLERFRLQYEMLLKQEAEQNDFIEQIMLQK